MKKKYRNNRNYIKHRKRTNRRDSYIQIQEQKAIKTHEKKKKKTNAKYVKHQNAPTRTKHSTIIEVHPEFSEGPHSAPLEPRSRFGGKLLENWLVCPQNGTAVLKGVKERHTSSENWRQLIFNLHPDEQSSPIGPKHAKTTFFASRLAFRRFWVNETASSS